MKRPLAYITAAWTGDQNADAEQAARYCRAVYEAGFSPVCPAHVLVVCGDGMTEDVKNDIAVAGRLNITATTLDGILTVKGQGREARRD